MFRGYEKRREFPHLTRREFLRHHFSQFLA